MPEWAFHRKVEYTTQAGQTGCALQSGLQILEENLKMKQLMTNLLKDESGQDLIEYALIAALIALVAITALTSVGTKVSGVLGDIASSL